MINQKIIELQSFKKGKREVFVDFINSVVEWKNRTYKLTYKNVGGKMYPYVIIENAKPLSEITPLIDQIVEGKEDLKGMEYDMNKHSYYIAGIGGKSIKVFKDGKKTPEYLWYHTTETQQLLDILIKDLSQLKLILS